MVSIVFKIDVSLGGDSCKHSNLVSFFEFIEKHDSPKPWGGMWGKVKKYLSTIVTLPGAAYANDSQQYAKDLIHEWAFGTPSMQRWFFTTNHKEIGLMYVIFGTFCGLIGSILS